MPVPVIFDFYEAMGNIKKSVEENRKQFSSYREFCFYYHNDYESCMRQYDKNIKSPYCKLETCPLMKPTVNLEGD